MKTWPDFTIPTLEDDMSNQFPPTGAVSILRYERIDEALSFLERAFGLVASFVADDHGVIVHAQVRAGSSSIFLSPDVADDRYAMRSPRHLNGTNQCVYLVVDGDIDHHAATAGAAGAEIVTEPHDTEYGGREYSCRDPEGHVWSIGTYAGEASS